MDRREALRLLGAGALAALAARRADAATQPNILWLSCEDMSPHLGCYGDPHAKTPTLDALATQGTRYTNAYTTAGVCAPCRSTIISGMYATTLGSHHMRCKATLPPFVQCFPTYLRKAGYYCTNNSKQDYNFSAPKGSWDESSGKAHWKKRPKDAPFFAVFNYTGTHEGRIGGGEDVKLSTLPPYYPDTPVTRGNWASYYRNIAKMDGWVAEKLRELDEAGLTDSTIVFFWSDHGVGLPRAKRWLYDSGTHVPLIVRIPPGFRIGGQGKPGSVTDELVSFVDLAPTVLNLAGVPVPKHLQGRAFLGADLTPPRDYIYGARDRMDERYDIIRSVRDKRYRYIRNYEPFKAYYQYMNTPEKGGTMRELRRLHAEGKLPAAAELFMANSKPLEELYDLEKDPHEIHNLADSPDHRDVLERLRAAHVKWVLDTRDLGLVPEPEITVRTKKHSSCYAILRQPGAEGLMARIRATAALGEKGEAAMPELLKALTDQGATVRYWAAIGLGNLGPKAKPATQPLTAALKDSSAVVRIAAARALCFLDLDDQAVPLLIEELKGPQQWARLHAAIVLDSIGDKARPALPALHAALKNQPNKYITRVANHALNVLEGTTRRVR